ncbi:MAG: hypothetical protein NUV80_03435 [Candidatus Berkelbacteria bacterium]|nr:hypothetical protein [Candidatus Berkelbacteria bacterium]MCR4307588.1 hypothetical protein [Candidatus Berkelbacteria bacterium]
MSDLFVAPTKPGFQVLLDSISELSSDSPKPNSGRFAFSNLEARAREFIPPERRQEVCDAVYELGDKIGNMTDGCLLPDAITGFLLLQLGPEELAELLKSKGGKWELRKCEHHCNQAYHAYTTDPERLRSSAGRAAEQLANMIFSDLTEVSRVHFIRLE